MTEPDIRYEPNPKHKEPWQPGRKGTLCPPPNQLSTKKAMEMLKNSDLEGKKRYATFGGKAYCAQEHRAGLWHGYPISWHEVPPRVKSKWLEEGLVTRKEMRD